MRCFDPASIAKGDVWRHASRDETAESSISSDTYQSSTGVPSRQMWSNAEHGVCGYAQSWYESRMQRRPLPERFSGDIEGFPRRAAFDAATEGGRESTRTYPLYRKPTGNKMYASLCSVSPACNSRLGSQPRAERESWLTPKRESPGFSCFSCILHCTATKKCGDIGSVIWE